MKLMNNKSLYDYFLIENFILEIKMADKIFIDNLVNELNSAPLISLNKFITDGEFTVPKGDKSTNVINFAEKKNLCIPDHKISKFFVFLDKCRTDNSVASFEERQSVESSGIMLDIDRYQDTVNRQITDFHHQRVVGKLAELIQRSCDMPDGTMFHAFVIVKPSVLRVVNDDSREQATYKDGFHVLIPDVWISREHKRWIHTKMKESAESIFKNIPHNKKSVDSMIDTMSSSNPVFFLGNNRPGKPAYKLHSVYHIQSSSSDLPPGILPIELPKDESINLTYELSLSFKLSMDGDIKKIWLDKRVFLPKNEVADQIKLSAQKLRARLDELEEADNDISLLTINDAQAHELWKMLDILDPSYYDEYEKWFKVLCAIAHSSESYKPLALNFSKKSGTKFDMEVFEDKWEEAIRGRLGTTNPLTIRSIMYWANESNSEKLAEIKTNSYTRALVTYATKFEGVIQDGMCADILWMMCKDKFMSDSADSSTYTWYEFVLPGQDCEPGQEWKWRREGDPDSMYRFLSTTMPKVYTDVESNLTERFQSINDAELDPDEEKGKEKGKSLRKFWKKIIAGFKKSHGKLYSRLYCKSVINSCTWMFRKRGFIQGLDKVPDVIGVGNGVLKVGAKCELISRLHEYPISKFTPTRYFPVDWDNPHVKIIMEGISWVIPEEDAREYIMIYISTVLDRRPTRATILLGDGCGSNGKSWLMKMVHETMGDDHVVVAQPNIICGPQEAASQANSAIAILENKTLAYTDESAEGDTINDAKMKRMVNPNKVSNREIYGQQKNFQNTCNLISLTNHQFRIPTTDHGTWRRIKRYVFKAKFVESPDPNNPLEHLENEDYMFKMPYDMAYKEAMLSILVHYYELFMSKYNGQLTKVRSKTIARETEQYRDTQDTIDPFIKSYIVRLPTEAPNMPTVIPPTTVVSEIPDEDNINFASINLDTVTESTVVPISAVAVNGIDLEMLAGKYRDWHMNRYGSNKKDHDLQRIIQKLIHSRLEKSITMDDSEKGTLYGHRLLNHPTDELLPGEKRYGVVRKVKKPVSITPLD